METRQIGSLKVSAIGLGCNSFGWRLDADGTATVVHAALDAGINFFDTADIYGGARSEEYLGLALRGRRDKAIIATKFGAKLDDEIPGGARPEYVLHAAESSLRRLGTDYIDLYQIHWPDTTVPIEDTLGALNTLVRSGKVREIGCSNFSAEQLREAEVAIHEGAARFVSVQNRYSLLHRGPERDVIPECLRADIAFIPYVPFESSLLTGNWRRNQTAAERSELQKRVNPVMLTDHNLDIVEALIEYATSRGHSLLELVMSWIISRPAVASVIPGTISPERLRANIAAANWKLTDADLAAIDLITLPPEPTK